MSGESTARIVVVSHTAQLGGAEHSLFAVLERDPGLYRVVLFEDGPWAVQLRAAGIRVDILPAPPYLDSFRRKSGPLRALGAALGAVRQALRLRHQLAGARIVYLNSQKAAIIGSIAAALVRAPVVWHLRTVLDDHYSAFSRTVTVFLANHLSDRVIAATRVVADRFVLAGGRRSLVTLIPNGFDSVRYLDARSGRQGVRGALGLPDSSPVVACFSRLTRWKGQHVLLDAADRLPDVHVLLVGEALFEGDREYAEELRRRAAMPSLSGRVHFLGYRNDVVALMGAVDVVAVPSVETEAFGRVVVEALLCGVPVVASDLGGPAEILEQESTGLLVRPGDSAQLAEALRRALSGDPAVAEWGRRGRARAVEAFDLDAVRRRVLDLFERVAADPVGNS